jgi:hypothetical protein
MILKLFSIARATLGFTGSDSGFGIPEKLLESARSALRAELSNFGMKVFSGFILGSVIVFSLIQLGLALLKVFSRYENESIFIVTCFGGIALVCGVALYFTLYPRSKSEVIIVPEAAVDLQLLGARFAEGFLVGFQEKNSVRVQNNHS